MKKLICSIVLASSVLYIGCQKEEEDNPVAAAAAAVRSDADKAAKDAAKAAEAAKAEAEAAWVPTSDDYKKLLEKRKASVDGLKGDTIKQEVDRFERATDKEKRELYKKVKALVK